MFENDIQNIGYRQRVTTLVKKLLRISTKDKTKETLKLNKTNLKEMTGLITRYCDLNKYIYITRDYQKNNPYIDSAMNRTK